MKKIKLFAAPAILMIAMFAIVSVAHAGVLWSGIDPVFKVDGRKFNVWIEWPSEYTCTITEPIAVDVKVPRDSSYVFISESADDVGNCGAHQRTDTKVQFHGAKRNEVKVASIVTSDQTFPVVVKIYREGELVRVYEGMSNAVVTGKGIKIKGAERLLNAGANSALDTIKSDGDD
jgi:hypothetical protein